MDSNGSARFSGGSKVFNLTISPLLLFCFLVCFLSGVEAAYSYCPYRLDVSGISVPSSFSRDRGRIGGGTEAERNEFPWQAYVRISFWTNETAICGGTYIGNNWILSAAHCFYGATSVKVYLGAYYTDTVDADANVQVFQVALNSIIKHPDWNFEDTENDIAILKLARSPILSDFVSPIRLPFLDDVSLVGENVTLSGWGNYSSTAGATSPTLRKATSTVISSNGVDGECQTLTGLSFNGEKIICADGSQGTRSCYGDDGGPMNHFRPEEGDNWFVIGVAGVGKSTTSCLTSQLPNVYTRVQYYLNWIYGNTDLVPESHRTTTTIEQTTEAITTKTTTVELTTTTASTATTEISTEATTTRTTVEITTEATTMTTTNVFTCSGQPDGYYVNPVEPCSEIYFLCFSGEITEYICPSGMVFNVNICACDVSVNVAACNGKIN